MGFVYLFRVEGTDVYKIGSSMHPEKRILEIQTACPYKVIEVARFKSKHSHKVERAIHRKYSFNKVDEKGRELQGEFFNLAPSESELFIESCKKADNDFIILESNTYLQDRNNLK